MNRSEGHICSTYAPTGESALELHGSRGLRATQQQCHTQLAHVKGFGQVSQGVLRVLRGHAVGVIIWAALAAWLPAGTSATGQPFYPSLPHRPRSEAQFVQRLPSLFLHAACWLPCQNTSSGVRMQ